MPLLKYPAFRNKGNQNQRMGRHNVGDFHRQGLMGHLTGKVRPPSPPRVLG